MAQRVAGTVDPRPLAVPHGKHALDIAGRVQRRLLRAQYRGGAQILVHRGQEIDPRLLEPVAGVPHLEVEPAQGRAAITRDKARGVQPRRSVAPRLVQHDPHQRLRSGQEDPAGGSVIPVLQTVAVKGGLVPGHGGHPSCSRDKNTPQLAKNSVNYLAYMAYE